MLTSTRRITIMSIRHSNEISIVCYPVHVYIAPVLAVPYSFTYMLTTNLNCVFLPRVAPSISCTFEDGYACGYTRSSDRSLGTWSRKSKSEHVNEGPTVDHTYGNSKGRTYVRRDSSPFETRNNLIINIVQLSCWVVGRETQHTAAGLVVISPRWCLPRKGRSCAFIYWLVCPVIFSF